MYQMKPKKDLVSVIMSNYNTPEEYLRASIESILNQTYQNFEFIIVDDCSTDNSLSIIESYTDDRIKVIKNEQNLGITKSLNRGLAVAKGEFVARMDADDISLETRFAKQVEFLKNHPDHIVCGTGVKLIGDWQTNHTNEYICGIIPDKETYQIQLLFSNYPNIVHPTAMFNHNMLLEHNITYNENYPLAQDYRMWISCSEVAECANIPETLLYYRVHNKAISSDKKELQRNIAIQIKQEQLKKLHLFPSLEETEIHNSFFYFRKDYNLKTKDWIKTLLIQNRKYKVYNQKKIKNILWEKWTEISYYGLAKQKNPFIILKILFNIPVLYIPHLYKVRKSRNKKQYSEGKN